MCGQVRFVDTAAARTRRALYWRYEMWLRALESRLASVTAGNGAIYATRREAYIEVDPIMGHDLSFPFNMVKRGWRAVYAAGARATEKMVPSIEGEFARKRRMMSHGWPIVLRGGMLSPRGYGAALRADDRLAPGAALRHPVPARGGVRAEPGPASPWAPGRCTGSPSRPRSRSSSPRCSPAPCPPGPLLIARYYVLTQASLVPGLWDWLRHGTPAGWEPAEGTR